MKIIKDINILKIKKLIDLKKCNILIKKINKYIYIIKINNLCK